ncbi:MAG: penicillin-binding protein 2 [Lachnospiraceae bacterium]|nr:penicillin-binding protein 2 [Lachnospiraceae bacterium]
MAFKIFKKKDTGKSRKQSAREKNEHTNKEINIITWVFVIAFVALTGHIVYFTAFQSESFINNSYNSKRAELLARRIVRGRIVSADGKILAETVGNGAEEVRSYPYGSLFAHAVGFASQGGTGVESISGFTLLRSDDPINLRIKNDINGIKNNGDTVITTLDTGLQKAAYDAFGKHKGAVIAINVKTGEILAMVSKPDFDPNDIEELWTELNDDEENSPLVNRATLGLYPPGSTFKIVTALEYIKEHPDITGYEFDCNGSFTFEDITISCYHGAQHGHLDLKSSFARSCNSSFANITSQLDRKKFEETCSRLMFNSRLPSPFSYRESSVLINDTSKTPEVIQAGIGQGRTQVTPIHMAMITAAVANDGILMRPMVVSAVRNSRGTGVKTYSPTEYARLMSSEESRLLRELMREVVISGTGYRLQGTDGYEIAGKTGSAEYSKDKTKSHAWFTGFAPVDDPQIAVTVIAEGAGSGGESAAPVARKVFDAWFSK